MSVLSSIEIGGRDGSYGVDRNAYATTRIFQVTCSLATDTIEEIRVSGMVPALWSQHPRNPNLRVKNVSLRESHGPKVHDVAVEYDNEASIGTLPKLAEEFKPNPLERRLSVIGKSIHATEPLTKVWRFGAKTLSEFPALIASAPFPTKQEPFSNTATDAIEGQEKNADQFGWDVTWNRETIPFWLANLQNTINKEPILIRGLELPRWTCLFRDLSHSDQLVWRLTEETTPYYYFQIKFGIYFRKDTWLKVTPNVGFHQLKPGGVKEIILDHLNVPVNQPVAIDQYGAKIHDITPENFVYVVDSPFPEASWASIPSLA